MKLINICFWFYITISDFFLKFKLTYNLSRMCRNKAWEYARVAQYQYERFLSIFFPEEKTIEYKYSFTHVTPPKEYDIMNKWINRGITQIKICESHNSYTFLSSIEDTVILYINLDDSDIDRVYAIEDLFRCIVFYLTKSWPDIVEYNDLIKNELSLIQAIV